ncbi:MAG: ferric reductase-like transmembrane domain-containing protein [Pseudomonadota bacterium]
MASNGSDNVRNVLIWAALITAIVVPIAAAAASPLLAWRQPVYIVAGFAGVVAMVLLLVQPLLVGGYLPGLAPLRARGLHRWIGSLLVIAVIVHVVGLWITSPPDVVDALTVTSPTPFSAWGVIAMWAVFAAALLAALRRRLRVAPLAWRRAHTTLAMITVAGSVIHALLIQGTMQTQTKVLLCVLVVLLTVSAIVKLRIWERRRSARDTRS